MSNYCYIRVSTDKQEFNRQTQIFKDRNYIDNVNCQYICEKFTGTKVKRPVLDDLINKLNKDDTLIVESLSRLSRGGIIKTLDLITYLVQQKKVNIIVFKENFNFVAGEKPDANTNLLLGIFSVLGQFERDILSERTKEGLKAATAKGSKVGVPRSKYSSIDNFKYTIKLMVNENIGQYKATLKSKYPINTFKKDLAKAYKKYNTKSYTKILSRLNEEDSID